MGSALPYAAKPGAAAEPLLGITFSPKHHLHPWSLGGHWSPKWEDVTWGWE